MGENVREEPHVVTKACESVKLYSLGCEEGPSWEAPEGEPGSTAVLGTAKDYILFWYICE